MANLNGNGHTNGHKQILSGDAAAAMQELMPTTDLSRGDLKILLRQAGDNLRVFLEDPAKTRALRDVLYAVAMDPENRRQMRAAELLLKAIGDAVDQQIKLAEVEDKMRRLDTPGAVTERVEHYTVRMPEARNRLGEPLED